ncbi:hypothetical protein ACLB2K_022820 [Fragaria x ananassa]
MSAGSTLAPNLSDSGSPLGGKINPSLLKLEYLHFLDLSDNLFEGMQIPSFLGSLKSISHLDLSDSGYFHGTVPHQLGNPSSLVYLSLSGLDGLKVENLQWLSSFSRLKHLDLSSVNLSKASDHWLQVMNMLPYLAELHISHCGLDYIPPLPIVPIPIMSPNITSLKEIDFGSNYLSQDIPEWLFHQRNLTSLKLGNNLLQGSLPRSIGLTSIVTLDLRHNKLEGKIPNSLGNLCGLMVLNLSMNNFIVANVSEIFESLSWCGSDRLNSLSLGYNNLSGSLTEHVGKFKNLSRLDLSGNSITEHIRSN